MSSRVIYSPGMHIRLREPVSGMLTSLPPVSRVRHSPSPAGSSAMMMNAIYLRQRSASSEMYSLTPSCLKTWLA